MATTTSSMNVVTLPTAARRRVKNPVGLGLIAAAQDLPKHPAEWEDHGGRKAWQEAMFYRSPEMIVATAILKVLTDDQKDRVRRYVTGLAEFSFAGPNAVTAEEIVEAIL